MKLVGCLFTGLNMPSQAKMTAMELHTLGTQFFLGLVAAKARRIAKCEFAFANDNWRREGRPGEEKLTAEESLARLVTISDAVSTD